jgi:hypothetical protein
MHPSVPFVRPSITPERVAMVKVLSREDVIWNRPDRYFFKAPPLQVRPPLEDVAELAAERRRELHSL